MDLQLIREKLNGQQAILQERVQAEAERVNAPARSNPDQLDRAQDYVTRARSSVVLEVVQHELAEVEAALARVEAGTYGLCIECGLPINLERLEILPHAPYCITCQLTQEGARA